MFCYSEKNSYRLQAKILGEKVASVSYVTTLLTTAVQ